MATSSSYTPSKETITVETFMTEEELEAKKRRQYRELEVLRSELNSG